MSYCPIGVILPHGLYPKRGGMVKTLALLCMLLALALFGYQNCKTQKQLTQNIASNILFDITPKCIGDDNTATLKIDPDFVDTTLLKCKRIAPIADANFTDCEEIKLDNDGSNTIISAGNIVFTNLLADSYKFEVLSYQLVDNQEKIEQKIISIEKCTVGDTDLPNITNTTLGETCEEKRGGDKCKVCDIPSSLTETPKNKACPAGQACENGICKNTNCPICSGCQVCNPNTKECEDSNSECSGVCNICNNGVCSGATSCDEKRNGNTCKTCNNPNSCVETPRDLEVICGSGEMQGHRFSEANKPTCPTSEKTLCGVTCYSQGGLTCEQKRGQNNCTECNTLCGAPTNKTIICGQDNGASGDATNYPSAAIPTCIATQKTFCSTTCYSPAQTCEDKIQMKAMPQCWMCQNSCDDPVPDPMASDETCTLL